MKTYKTEWDLSLLYKDAHDTKIQKDINTFVTACSQFEKKYKNVDFTSSPSKLSVALGNFENIIKIGGHTPWWYFALKTDLNSDDDKSQAESTKIDQILTDATNKIKFFKLKISQIPKNKQKTYLKEKSLIPYSYMLKLIFDGAAYNLTEQEEQLQGLLSQTSYEMWIDANQKLLNKQTLKYKSKEIFLTEAGLKISDLPKIERRRLHIDLHKKFKEISFSSEAELNAIYNYKKIMDERRGYKKPYSATVRGYENDEKSIETLVVLVTKYFKISHKFYKIHAAILGDKTITMADRNAKAGEIKKKFDFETSIDIVRTAFNRIDKKYVDIFNSFLANGQIDVFPKKGKRGGAYCWGMIGTPTYVLLNHADTIQSVETLAHEMGHAIHTELSRNQPVHYQKYSTATAEVASTFFEQVASAELENYLSDNEKMVLLHNKILGDVSTIFRQIACFNFENDLHMKIRSEGQVSKEKIAELMTKHLKSYAGPAVDVTVDDGYFYVNWSHIRKFFYVYSYAYGQIISRALYENWKRDPSYASKIEQFLSAGRSMSPEDIFKKIGIDTSDPKFFESGLKGIEADIKRLEKMIQK